MTRQVEVHLDHLAVATRIKGIIERKVVSYGISGKVYVVLPSGVTRKMAIAGEGRLDLRGEAAEQPTAGPVGGDSTD